MSACGTFCAAPNGGGAASGRLRAEGCPTLCACGPPNDLTRIFNDRGSLEDGRRVPQARVQPINPGVFGGKTSTTKRGCRLPEGFQDCCHGLKTSTSNSPKSLTFRVTTVSPC